MPLKTTTSVVDFLSRYIPYTIGEEILVEDINQMLTYSVQEYQQPVLVDYDFGAAQQLIKTILLKNTTNNANIQITFEYDSLYVRCVVTDVDSGEVLNITPGTSYVMRPTTILGVQVLVNEVTIPVGGPFPTQVKISVQNISNGSLVTRRPELTPLQARFDSDVSVNLSI